MKRLRVPIFVLLVLISNAAQNALAQAPQSSPKPYKLIGQAPPEGGESYWDVFIQRMEMANARYAEEHPAWPKGEPAPRHIAKKALNGISGKNLLEAVREGVKLTREAKQDAPEPERDLQIELAIEGVLEYFPLIETNPQGYINLFYVISSVNSDPVYRRYLINRSHPSDLPDTLFSLYLQDKCRERLNEILNRNKNIIISPHDDTSVQKASIEAYKSLVFTDVVDALKADREAQRFADEKDVEISPLLLREMPESSISEETRNRTKATLLLLDELLLNLQSQFDSKSTRPDWLKAMMLDLIEDSLRHYNLPSAPQHIDFLAAQGRKVEGLSGE